jgi:hypothetical protein
MSEDFLHFIWKYGLFDREGMLADTGEKVHVTGLGEHNADAGPDFQNARIQIGNTVWAGNIEIHLSSSDWTLHKHGQDKAYDNVVLHAVYKYEKPVYRTNGEQIPTVVLQFNDKLYENYCNLVGQRKTLLCHGKVSTIDPFVIDIWLNSIVIERLQQKTEHIADLLKLYRNNWEEVFYVCLARAFGFGLNAVPFELTARSLPLNNLARHRNSIKQCEALVLGQAGFLDEAVLFDDYYNELRAEYFHLRKKFGLKPVQKHLWKFLRLRPVNFPTIRLSQFAALINKAENLFSVLLSCNNIQDIHQVLSVSASAFWDTHYTFDTPSPQRVKHFGTESVNTIIINVVVPFLFIYGKVMGKEEMKDRSIAWLNQLPPEKNRVTGQWAASGINAGSAFYSQALLQLTNTYCKNKRCLACPIGSALITAV